LSHIRIIHFLNQFFSGVGGENKGDAVVDAREEALGSGKRFLILLGYAAEIVVTAYCGDGYLAIHYDEALEDIIQISREHNVRMVVVDPAFASDRYGFTRVLDSSQPYPKASLRI